ncbi:hypothetical protein [Emcibacter sp.]|uniref:hypothetical protein n=1 Tax=Emcibacter sp. TaxID=1979954 RepID=UPI003A92DB61
MMDSLITNLLYDVDGSASTVDDSKKETAKEGEFDEKRAFLEKKLRRILTESSAVRTGQVQLLGLGQIKNMVGDKKWLSARKSVLFLLQQIVEKNISREDVFFSRSDDEHLIVFAKLKENEARLVCARILQELTLKLLGNVETKDIIVRTATGHLDGVLAFKEATLEEILNSVQDLKPVEVPDKVTGRDPSEKRSVNGLSSYINRQKGRVRDLINVTYLPIWDARHDVLSTYAVDFNLKNKPSAGSYVNLIGKLKSRDKVVFDHVLAEDCEEMLREFSANKFRALFSVPVCYETVFNPELMSAYVSVLQQIPPDLRRYMIITLMEFPAGIPESKFRYITSCLSKFSQMIVLYCPDYIPQDLTLYKECGVRGISMSIPEGKRNDQLYWNKLILMADKCDQNSIKTTVINVHTPNELFLAREAGFDFIAGDSISKHTEIPGHMVKINWKELLAGKRPSF